MWADLSHMLPIPSKFRKLSHYWLAEKILEKKRWSFTGTPCKNSTSSSFPAFDGACLLFACYWSIPEANKNTTQPTFFFFFFPFGYCNEPCVSRCQVYSKNHRENTPDRGLTMHHLIPFKLYGLNPYFIPSMYSLCFPGIRYVSSQQSALSVILYAKWLPPSTLMEYFFIGKN